MRCYVQTPLDTSADAAWSAVKKPATLVWVARGLLAFSGADNFPVEWRQGFSVRTRLWFFHVLPGWWVHEMSVASLNDQQRYLRSRERGAFYTWDHTIRVQPLSKGCQYSDEIEIRAGLLTAFIWLYANFFYRYRQMRWRRLARMLIGGKP